MELLRDFDERFPLSIEAYGRRLIGHNFMDIIDWASMSPAFEGFDKNEIIKQFGNECRKGGLANLVERWYFGYNLNNSPAPDFKLAGVELKVTPYEIKRDGSKKAGERLVLTMISYNDPVEPEFYKSHLWDK